MKWLCTFLILILASKVHAFPEMVRHGYTRCTVCHIDLAGGGLLTPYGRSLSRELLSQPTLGGKPSIEGDEAPLWGFVQTPEWLNLGGDVRVMQTFLESKQASKGAFIVMQVQVDSAAQLSDRVMAFFSLGRVEAAVDDPTAKDFVSSPTHGIDVLLTPPEQDERLTLKVGRFKPAYGIRFAEHAFVSRSWLDFGPGQERYAGELAWVTNDYEFIGTSIFSQTNDNKIVHEQGGILQATTTVGTTSKVGVNYYQSHVNDGTLDFDRQIYGAFAEMGFSKQWYGLLEIDRPLSITKKWGFVETFKLGYEIQQGLHLFGVHEIAAEDMEKTDQKFESYSVGVDWFPRPHWDFYSLYRKSRDTTKSNDFNDSVWLIGHFYL